MTKKFSEDTNQEKRSNHAGFRTAVKAVAFFSTYATTAKLDHADILSPKEQGATLRLTPANKLPGIAWMGWNAY